MSVNVVRACPSVARRSAAHAVVDPLRRQILRPAVNGRIRASACRLSPTAGIDPVCERGRRRCFETVPVSAIVCADVRRFGARLLAKAGHVAQGGDGRSVAESDRIIVVEQTRPDDAVASIRAGPRRAGVPAEAVHRTGP